LIVVDATVAVKLVFAEDDSALAFELVASQLVAREELVAPDLLRYELTNVVRQRVRRGELTAERAPVVLETLLGLRIQYKPWPRDEPWGLHARAFALAEEFDLPAAYDAHYIALAETLGCDLWTADARLVRAVAGRLAFVRALDTFAPDTGSGAAQTGSQ
jgi:predicted nucleic acid-binding protein